MVSCGDGGGGGVLGGAGESSGGACIDGGGGPVGGCVGERRRRASGLTFTIFGVPCTPIIVGHILVGAAALVARSRAFFGSGKARGRLIVVFFFVDEW